MNDQIYPDVLESAVLSENKKLGSKRPRVIKKLMKPSPLKLQTNTGSLTTPPLNQETKPDFQASIDTALKLIKEAKTILDALVDEKKALSTNDSCHTPVCTSSANSDQIKSLKWSLSEKIWPPNWVEEPRESIFSSLNKSPTLTYIHSGPICATKNSIPNSTQLHDTLKTYSNCQSSNLQPPTHMDSQSNSCSEAAQSKLYKNYCQTDKVNSNLQPVSSTETNKNVDKNPINGQKMNKLLLKLKIWAQENDKKTIAEGSTQESATLNHQPPTNKTVNPEEKPKSAPLPPSTPSSKQTSSSPVSNNKVPLPVEQKSNSFSTKSSPNKTNHKHNNSNSSSTRNKRDRSMFINCYNCGGPHSFRKCPQPKKHKFCYNCGWPDVLSSECPFCNGKLVRPGATESVRKGGDRCRKF